MHAHVPLTLGPREWYGTLKPYSILLLHYLQSLFDRMSPFVAIKCYLGWTRESRMGATLVGLGLLCAAATHRPQNHPPSLMGCLSTYALPAFRNWMP